MTVRRLASTLTLFLLLVWVTPLWAQSPELPAVELLPFQCAGGCTINGPVYPTRPAITAGSGTGVTVDNVGEIREVVYKVTVAETAFVCAALTCDVTLATLPAKTLVTGALADLTETFACSAVCTTATLSMVLGRGSGGAQFLASFDADAATAQLGDADAELGTTLVRAAAVQAGSPESWSSTQAVVVRLTSGTGNIGDGAANNLSQGAVTFYLTTRVYP